MSKGRNSVNMGKHRQAAHWLLNQQLLDNEEELANRVNNLAADRQDSHIRQTQTSTELSTAYIGTVEFLIRECEILA
jgi:hypothetical protein